MILQIFLQCAILLTTGSKGAEIQSFFPIVTKEASKHEELLSSQTQHWNSAFQPHQIGQVPLLGNYEPYDNLYYEIGNSNRKKIVNNNRLNKNTYHGDLQTHNNLKKENIT